MFFRIRYLGCIAAGTVLLMHCACREPVASKADLIFINGRIYTVDENHPWVEAVAIFGDRILAVGSTGEMDIYKDTNTSVIDLKGKFACPGFNDAHIQDLSGYFGRADIDLHGITSMAQWRQEVRNHHRNQSRKAIVPPDKWIIGQGWDQSLMEDSVWPDNEIFKYRRIWINRPMLFYRICGHAALANPKALRIACIDKHTPNPPGGEIVKDPRTGQPTGLLKESAIDLLTPYLPLPDIRKMGNGVRRTLHMAASMGITSLQGCGRDEVFHIFKAFKDADSLTCRINFWGNLDADYEELSTMRQISDDNMLRVGLLSASLDGAMGTCSAALLWPYLDNPEHRGIPKFSQDELSRLIISADEAHEQVAVDVIGDDAARMALESFQLLNRLHPSNERRHRLEHVQLITTEDMKRAGDLNIVASIQPSHLLDDIRWVEKRLGPERCQNAYPWRALADNGVRLAMGTYWPVVSLNPIYGLYAAVTRRDTTGYPAEGWHAKQRLSMAEALSAYTLGSAYAENMEEAKGRLCPGKLADMVVLDRNLFEINSDDILDTRVLMTILGGRIIYRGDD
ncbi:amidohydrolase [bacterium]|nr:amidohydrolase [bacterium]